LDLIEYQCEQLFDTAQDEDEFIVVMRVSTSRLDSLENWRRAAETLRSRQGTSTEIETAKRPENFTEALMEAISAFRHSERQHADEIISLRQSFAMLERRTHLLCG
jgi:hypothetical protein